MESAIQHANNTINTLESSRAHDNSFQESLFTLWRDLENSLETISQSLTTSSEDDSDFENKLDEIIEAQDQVARAACQSRASTYEDLLFKLAIWRSDTPDFESIPIYGDRKDRIVYSVFRDLVKITGIEHVKTHVDNETNFLGIGQS